MMPDNKEASDTAGEQPVDAPIDESGSAESAQDFANDNAETITAESTPSDTADTGEEVLIDEDPGEEDELEALKRQLAETEARAGDNWDRLVRLQAEMENQRKRAQNDVDKARKFALEGIVNDLLPVKDSLEMGLAAASADDAEPGAIIEGAELTLKMLAQVFERNNIAEINPVDEKFNPEFHQAMSMQEIEGKAPNTVASVMQKGYTLNERLVRPALVMVAK